MQPCSVEHIARKTPIPHYGLLKHAAAARPRHTRMQKYTFSIKTGMNLVFICMTSEHTNLKPTEVVLPAAIRTKVK